MLYESVTPVSGSGSRHSEGRAAVGRESCLHAGGLALLLLSTAACGAGDEAARSFEPGRVVEPVGRPTNWEATSAERFGISARDFSLARPAGEPRWETPAGWSELPSTQFREANFRVAGDERAECYLSSLAGEGGGLAANVNRWRTQMSLEPLTDEQVAALPRESWLGGEAVFLDVTGTWTGMGGGDSAGGWRLVGLLRVEPAGSRFLKMTGPADLLAGELENFRRLAASLGAGHEAAHDHDHDHEPAPDAGSGTAAGLPPGHPPLEPAPAGVGAGSEAANTSPSGFAWTPPAGWSRGPEKAMREITYLVDGSECYVTLLAGDGGGLLANVNRWCQQMGQAALGADDLAGLARVPVLGASGLLVELERGPQASVPQERLLGLVLMLEGQSLFVKMTGPRALLERERGAFLDFCRSTRRVP